MPPSDTSSGSADTTNDPRSALPAVSKLLESDTTAELLERYPRSFVVEAIRETLAWYRRNLTAGEPIPNDVELACKIASFLGEKGFQRIRPVINATGIVLHTNLGRAVLPKAAVQALAGMDHCANLEVDLESGKRGMRGHMLEQLLCRLTGAEAALVVNNNAAATLLILAGLCVGKEVVVSRGQLIEIGGSFRLPDCIHQSGAKLVEVGTTNKTHVRDYENALNENTGAMMHVHPSNYRVIGFSKTVPIEELVAIRDRHPVPELVVIDDLGCGALVDLEQYGLPHEPTALESVAAGADVVCFSGDKLISGPQAGIIVGKQKYIQRLRKHPLARMLRIDKLTDLALERTLRLFLEPETLLESNPTLAMLAAPPNKLRHKAVFLRDRIITETVFFEVAIEEGESAVGGGSLPGIPLPTYLVTLKAKKKDPDAIHAALRRNEPPIIARVANDAVLLDMRTLLKGDEAIIVNAVKHIAEEA